MKRWAEEAKTDRIAGLPGESLSWMGVGLLWTPLGSGTGHLESKSALWREC